MQKACLNAFVTVIKDRLHRQELKATWSRLNRQPAGGVPVTTSKVSNWDFMVGIIFVFSGECIVYDEGYGGARRNLVTNPLGDVFYNLDFRKYLHLISMAERVRWERGWNLVRVNVSFLLYWNINIFHNIP